MAEVAFVDQTHLLNYWAVHVVIKYLVTDELY